MQQRQEVLWRSKVCDFINTIKDQTHLSLAWVVTLKRNLFCFGITPTSIKLKLNLIFFSKIGLITSNMYVIQYMADWDLQHLTFFMCERYVRIQLERISQFN
jgi:hypothetical protein